MDAGQSIVQSPSIGMKLHSLNIFSCNIRFVMGKFVELGIVLEYLNVNLVLLQESWLDVSVEYPNLPDFVLISRRDLSEDPNRGGVLSYARRDLNNVMFYKESQNSERMWHLFQHEVDALRFVTGTYRLEIASRKSRVSGKNLTM